MVKKPRAFASAAAAVIMATASLLLVLSPSPAAAFLPPSPLRSLGQQQPRYSTQRVVCTGVIGVGGMIQ